jgi:transcriptional regulator with XRE-family HTH domain
MTTETPNVWKSLREASGLSLREVARRTGINPGRLSSIERGPTPEEATKLRAVLAAALTEPSAKVVVEDGSVPA